MTQVIDNTGNNRYRLIARDGGKLLLIDDRDGFRFIVAAKRLSNGWRIAGAPDNQEQESR